jgi:hypothetical protein
MTFYCLCLLLQSCQHNDLLQSLITACHPNGLLLSLFIATAILPWTFYYILYLCLRYNHAIMVTFYCLCLLHHHAAMVTFYRLCLCIGLQAWWPCAVPVWWSGTTRNCCPPDKANFALISRIIWINWHPTQSQPLPPPLPPAPGFGNKLSHQANMWRVWHQDICDYVYVVYILLTFKLNLKKTASKIFL